jgi:hypothetical protein
MYAMTESISIIAWFCDSTKRINGLGHAIACRSLSESGDHFKTGPLESGAAIKLIEWNRSTEENKLPSTPIKG